LAVYVLVRPAEVQMPDDGGGTLMSTFLPSNLIIADVIAHDSAHAIKPPSLPASDEGRLNLPD